MDSNKRAEEILCKMRNLEVKYPNCEAIQLLGTYLDNHVEDTLEREEECHDERLSACERVVFELNKLGEYLNTFY